MTTSTSISTSLSQSSLIYISASSACKKQLRNRNFLPAMATSSMLCLIIHLPCLGCNMPSAPELPRREISHCFWSHFCTMLTLLFLSQHMATMFLENQMNWLMLSLGHRNFGLTMTSGQHTRCYVPCNAIECRHRSLRCSTLVSCRN